MQLKPIRYRRGSSPLARGTLHNQTSKDRTNGLIPARAGNTALRLVKATRGWAHPRSRGEHHPRTVPRPLRGGSSPLARGTPAASSPWRCCRGLIPARAGNTAEDRGVVLRNRAHPRSRGEHSNRLSQSVQAQGSSPLARGTRAALFVVARAGGLIPARAGNTSGAYGWARR